MLTANPFYTDKEAHAEGMLSFDAYCNYLEKAVMPELSLYFYLPSIKQAVVDFFNAGYTFTVQLDNNGQVSFWPMFKHINVSSNVPLDKFLLALPHEAVHLANNIIFPYPRFLTEETSDSLIPELVEWYLQDEEKAWTKEFEVAFYEFPEELRDKKTYDVLLKNEGSIENLVHAIIRKGKYVRYPNGDSYEQNINRQLSRRLATARSSGIPQPIA